MMDELEGLANRGYTEGFYRRHPPAEYQNYELGASRSTRQQFVGDIVEVQGGWLTIAVRNRFEAGDLMELVTPACNTSFQLERIESREGECMDAAPGSGYVVRIPLPAGIEVDSIDDFALLVRHLPAA
jgi:putative protease